MREELPTLTTWRRIGLIMVTPGYNDGAAFLDKNDMADIARLLDKYKAERDAERDALRGTLRAVLDILKSGRSTGRDAIKALYAAEDAITAALDA